jgi:putative ABC transport system ATP-binding protein
MQVPIIETTDLTKTYGMGEVEVHALCDVNFSVNEGEFVAIMGPSGSGKSTLMNILGCLDRPTSGTYTLAGVDVSQMNKAELAHIRNHRIGFIFQSYNLLPRTTAIDNVILPMTYNRESHLSPEERMQKGLKVLEDVGLAGRAHHMPNEISGGQAQRIAIARALVNDPVLILADEPTGNLDSQSSKEIMAILEKLHEQGRTIVMVTHDRDIAAFAQRIIHFKDGHVDLDQPNGHKKSVLEGSKRAVQ